jgi:hypothetical protein
MMTPRVIDLDGAYAVTVLTVWVTGAIAPVRGSVLPYQSRED